MALFSGDFGDIEVRVENDNFRLLSTTTNRYFHLVREALEDIAEEIEEQAKLNTPVDKDPDAYSWRDRPGDGKPLRSHPVDVDKEFQNVYQDKFGIRGGNPKNIGQFSSAKDSILGRSIGEITLTVTKRLPYAIWVHEGTEPHRAQNAPFMRYKSFGKWHRRVEVAGQEPQPFLTDAFLQVEDTYVPLRIERLRAEL